MRSSTRGQSTSGRFTQRSTLTSFRGGNNGSFRNTASTVAHEPLPTTRRYHTNRHGYHNTYYGTYGGWSAGWWTPSVSVGVGVRLGFGSVGLAVGTSVGFGYASYYGSSYGYRNSWYHYRGRHSDSWYNGRGWVITPHTHWSGYRRGYSWYRPSVWECGYDTWRFGGTYCRVTRPWWYSWGGWYDWNYDSGYRYGRTRYVSITVPSDDNYEDGYDDGYDRGYENGAEDASGLRDARRRDTIFKKSSDGPRPRVDKTRVSAKAEFNTQMDKGASNLATGDYRGATKAFKEAVILSPESAAAKYRLSLSALADGKTTFAAFALRRAMDLDGPMINARDMLPEAGDLDRLLESLRADIEKAPEDYDLLLLDGFYQLQAGNAKAAAISLDKTLQQDPDNKRLKSWYAEALDALSNE